jgi:hypothetical protein
MFARQGGLENIIYLYIHLSQKSGRTKSGMGLCRFSFCYSIVKRRQPERIIIQCLATASNPNNRLPNKLPSVSGAAVSLPQYSLDI